MHKLIALLAHRLVKLFPLFHVSLDDINYEGECVQCGKVVCDPCLLAWIREAEKIVAKVQDEAVVAAQRSLDLSVTRYKGGVTSYLEVTTAQSAALGDEVTAVNILGRRMANTVLLIQALGGGWDRSSLPDRPECCGKLRAIMPIDGACEP